MSQEFQNRQLAAIVALEQSFRRGLSSATVVPLMEDPANDERLCLTGLAFLAPQMKEILQEKLIRPMRLISPEQYFYPAESLHVTIQNVRSINFPPSFNEADINTAREVFRQVVPKHKPLNLQLRRIFELPTSLAVCAFSDESLQALVDDLRSALAGASLPDDKQYGGSTVFGNVTICRYIEEADEALLELVSELKDITIGTMQVTEIALVITNAVCHPAKTQVIERFKLAHSS